MKLRGLILDVACLCPLLVWWFATVPGYFSSDSLDVWQQIHTGEWTNVHTTMFTSWVYLTTLNGSLPSLLTLSQTILLATSLIILARELFPPGGNDRIRRAVLITMSLSPSLAGFSIMAWKDVPYAAGILFVTAALLRIMRHAPNLQVSSRLPYVLLTAGTLFVTGFRWNGPITMVLIGVVTALGIRPIRMGALAVITLTIGIGVASLIVPERLDLVQGPTWLQLNSRPLHDIAVGISNGSFVPNTSQTATLVAVMPIENWKVAGDDCSTHDEMMFSEFSRLEEQQRENLRDVIPLWRVLLREEPLTIAVSRVCKFLPSVLPVQLGPTRPLALWSRPNSLVELGQPNHLGFVSRAVERVVDRSNTSSVLNWALFRTPVWFVVNIALLAWLYRRRAATRSNVLMVGVAFAVQVSAGLVAYAQDYRYTAGALFLLQLNAIRMIINGVRGPRESADLTTRG